MLRSTSNKRASYAPGQSPILSGPSSSQTLVAASFPRLTKLRESQDAAIIAPSLQNSQAMPINLPGPTSLSAQPYRGPHQSASPFFECKLGEPFPHGQPPKFHMPGDRTEKGKGRAVPAPVDEDGVITSSLSTSTPSATLAQTVHDEEKLKARNASLKEKLLQALLPTPPPPPPPPPTSLLPITETGDKRDRPIIHHQRLSYGQRALLMESYLAHGTTFAPRSCPTSSQFSRDLESTSSLSTADRARLVEDYIQRRTGSSSTSGEWASIPKEDGNGAGERMWDYLCQGKTFEPLVNSFSGRGSESWSFNKGGLLVPFWGLVCFSRSH